jgi:hypothetical protein
VNIIHALSFTWIIALTSASQAGSPLAPLGTPNGPILATSLPI